MQETNLLEVLEDGLVLIMLDGSRWRVAGGEHTNSITWFPPEEVYIEGACDGTYVITRQCEWDSVTAWPE